MVLYHLCRVLHGFCMKLYDLYMNLFDSGINIYDLCMNLFDSGVQLRGGRKRTVGTRFQYQTEGAELQWEYLGV